MDYNAAMPTVDFTTSLGVLPISGAHDDRPKVLAINGFAAGPDEMSRLGLLVAPRYDGLVGFLPGDRNPSLSETSVAAFARAFDEVVDQLGPTVVLGLSIGGLVALAMRSPAIVRTIAVEPPLMTGKLWPFLDELRNGLGGRHTPVIESIFGVSAAGVEGRDYTALLEDLHRPTDVIVGDEPLMPARAVARLPSFVDEPERHRLAAHPLVTLHLAPNAGHNVPAQAPQVLLGLLRQRLAEI